jgi:hypothetical protein
LKVVIVKSRRETRRVSDVESAWIVPAAKLVTGTLDGVDKAAPELAGPSDGAGATRVAGPRVSGLSRIPLDEQ